jgi:hypothetical protein
MKRHVGDSLTNIACMVAKEIYMYDSIDAMVGHNC